MIKHYRDEWIQEWCEQNGWTDLFTERNLYWAFPPNAVMPEPISNQTLRLIKSQKGLCSHEKTWLILAFIGTLTGLILSYILKCPMPVVFAFAFDAITVGQLEIEEI